MLQWLGVLVPGEGIWPRIEQVASKPTKVRSIRDKLDGEGAARGAAALAEQYPETVTTRARRLMGKINEAHARSKVQPEAFNIDTGEVLSWPNVESMLSGEPPEGYDQALMRAAVGSGGAITEVDPERGTVTVSALPETPQMEFERLNDEWARRVGEGINRVFSRRSGSALQAIERESFPSTETIPGETWKRCHCSRLVPPSEWSEPHGCCDDCYWALPDSREERARLMQDDDRERLLDEERD